MDKFRLLEGYSREMQFPELPEGTEIYNAARPFPAHQEWTGEFLHGVFFGAIFPTRILLTNIATAQRPLTHL